VAKRNWVRVMVVLGGTAILVLATMTMSHKPEIAGVPIPVSQRSVELYTPVAGGAAMHGRLAPRTLNVPGMGMIPAPGEADEEKTKTGGG